jgi:hypothetical protein
MENKPEDWDWLGFLLSWHEKEYERRYTLEGLVSTPIGLLTGAFALMYLFSTQYDYKHSSNFSTGCFLLPLVSSLAYALCSASHIYRSYAVVKNKVYRGVPDARALRQHMTDLVGYYKENEPQEDATRKFKEYFVELLSDQLTTNVLNNDERTRDIQNAKPPLRNSLLALLLILPAFFYNQINKPDTVYQVALAPTTTLPMSKQPATQPTAPPQKVTPVAPVPPQERQIKEEPRPNIKTK